MSSKQRTRFRSVHALLYHHLFVRPSPLSLPSAAEQINDNKLFSDFSIAELFTIMHSRGEDAAAAQVCSTDDDSESSKTERRVEKEKEKGA